MRCIDGSWVLGRSWRGARGVPRTILAGHRRFAGIWGVLGIFGDICSKWHGGAPPGGAEDPSSQDPRSNMNEGADRLNDRVGWAEIAAAGPADTAALPEFARFGSAFTMGGEFPIKGVLAGSLGIRGIRKDFPIFSAFSDILFRAKNAKENWDKEQAQRRKMPGFDMDERYKQLGTFPVRRSGLKAGASSRSPNASRGLEGHLPLAESFRSKGAWRIVGDQRDTKRFSDILFRAKNAKENWDKDEGAAEKKGRVRYQ